MSYRPPVKTNETLNGLAKVTKAKKGAERYFRVVLTQGSGDDATTTEMFVKPDKAPKYLDAGEWRVRMSADKTEMYSAIPSDAIVTAEFSDIVHREGEEPAPVKRTTKFGDVFQFTWLWKVCDGSEFEGIEVPHYLNYNFDYVQNEKGEEVVAYSHPKSKYTEQLDAVLTSAGIWNKGAILFKENLLPVLKKRAIYEREEHGVKVKLTINNGYIIAVKPVAAGWDDDGDYNPEQPKEPEASVPDDDVVEEKVKEEVTETSDDHIPWDEE